MDVLLAIVFGIAAGVLGGLVGIGGGVLFVPALVIFLDEPQVRAEATSLLAGKEPKGAPPGSPRGRRARAYCDRRLEPLRRRAPPAGRPQPGAVWRLSRHAGVPRDPTR